MLTSDSFLTIAKTSDSVDELQAIKEKVDAEIARQRSNDTGGDDGTFFWFIVAIILSLQVLMYFVSCLKWHDSLRI